MPGSSVRPTDLRSSTLYLFNTNQRYSLADPQESMNFNCHTQHGVNSSVTVGAYFTLALLRTNLLRWRLFLPCKMKRRRETRLPSIKNLRTFWGTPRWVFPRYVPSASLTRFATWQPKTIIFMESVKGATSKRWTISHLIR